MKSIILLISLLTLQHTANSSPLRAKRSDTLQIDTTHYAVLAYNKSRDSFLFNKESRPANITANEIKLIEKIIAVTVKEYNKSKVNIIKDSRKYYKQIIAVTNLRGEKEVWVNCFCTTYEKRHWRKGVVMVLDGGPCFFNLKINLNTKTVMNLSVNGVA